MKPSKNGFQASLFLPELLTAILLLLLGWVFKPFESLQNAVLTLLIYVVVLLLRPRLVEKRNQFSSTPIPSFVELDLPDRIVIFDKNGRYRYVLGDVRHPDAYPKANILGKSIDEIFADRQEFVAFCHSVIDDILSSNEAKLIEYQHHFQGVDYPIEAHVAPFMDTESGERMVIWISRDIKQRKQMEASLLESEKRLRAFVQVLPDRVIVMDAEGIYHDVLRSNYDTLPLVSDSGASVYERFDKAFSDFVIEKVRETIAKQENLVFHYDFNQANDNKTYQFEGRTVPYNDPLTGENLVIWMSRDITMQNETHRALEARERLLKHIIAALPDRTSIFDKDANYVDILQPSSSHSQREAMNIEVRLGHRIHEFFPAEFGDFCQTIIHKTLATKEVQVIEHNSPIAGEAKVFEARTISFTNPHTGEDNVLWLSRDVTERKQLETKRLELALHQEKLEFFKQFVDNLTHDLKTPLAVIKTNLYLLKNAPNEAQKLSRAEAIDMQVNLLREMIDDILTLSKLDNFSDLTSAEIDLKDLLHSLIEDLRSTAEKKAITLQFTNETEQAIVFGSPSEIRRAFSNLLDNAIIYTPQAGTIFVRLRNDELNFMVSIQDNGIGIETKDIPHIFERFFRSETARFTAAGTGLGLAITRRIIELHRGTIDVESMVNKGTSFFVRLPAIPKNLENSFKS